jgi:hypothetical protein
LPGRGEVRACRCSPDTASMAIEEFELLHTSESSCIFFSGYYNFFQLVDGDEMDFDYEE